MVFGRSLTRGYFDEMSSDKGALRVSGWMLNPRHRSAMVEVVVNRKVVAAFPPQIRDDVAKAFPWIPHAAQSGFQIVLNDIRSGDQLEVVGRRGRRVVARLKTTLRGDLDRAVPTPPEELVRRVAGGVSVPGYKADGLRHFTDFAEVANVGWNRRI